jgi:hypothetical protein
MVPLRVDMPVNKVVLYWQQASFPSPSFVVVEEGRLLHFVTNLDSTVWLSGEYSLLLVGWMTGCITLRSLNKKDDWGREVDGSFLERSRRD